ncbi:MAG: ATP-binding protein [Phenylobacterium sp.]|uniref:ATP-binding protein n=1 Tax=Phenylobacterium sp. TaxID=1871053 RepID=UPI002737608E|nr:ATP-binding protein [Phenylobacterium sp.]MDP3749556.1 ATP-binding protein [Phenylobacterium sp.]
MLKALDRALQEDQDLQDVMLVRAQRLRFRLFVCAVTAAMVQSLAGWQLTLAWLVGFSALQGLESICFPVRRLPEQLITAAGRRLSVGAVFLSGVVFAVLPMAAAWNGGHWGILCAALVIAGAAINAILTSGASRVGLAASAIPQGAAMLLLPLVAMRAGIDGFELAAIAWSTAYFILVAFLAAELCRKTLQAEQGARAEAQRATEAKSQFMAMVGHELRTPISAILAGAGSLDRSSSPAAVESNANLILSSTTMMRTLLNDLLDLSKIEAGRMSVEEIAFDLRGLVREAFAFWRTEALSRGLRLRPEGMRQTPRWVTGDPTRLRQILNNLISNALKFTPSGSVTLRVSMSPHLALSVTDTGPGMSPEHAARLFGAYEQLGAATARNHGGTGLGLNISRNLANLMGGDLSVETKLGEGSTFRLDLPLPLAEPPQDAAAPTLEAMGEESGLLVLIADDHEVNRTAFAMMLESTGAQVEVAVDGDEALRMLRRHRFDIALLDVNMPGLSGIDATLHLRGEPGPNRHMPILALSASVSSQDVNDCLAAGMNGFVRKPVDARELFAAINRAVADDRRMVA